MDKLIVSSSDFAEGGLIPIDCTGYGADHSPELVLSGLCQDAISLAITLDDLSHLIPDFNHWVIWNISASAVIAGSIPPGAQVAALGGTFQGIGYGRHRYRGPKPPLKRRHQYRFTVFALDAFLNLPPTAKKKELLRAMQGHILQQAELKGYYC